MDVREDVRLDHRFLDSQRIGWLLVPQSIACGLRGAIRHTRAVDDHWFYGTGEFAW